MQNFVILPGWLNSSDDWTSFSLNFEKIAKIFIYDFPGFGKKPINEEFRTYDDYVTNTENDLMKIFGNSPILLLGHSFGGRIAIELAARKNLHINKLILYATPFKQKQKSFKTFIHNLIPCQIRNKDDYREAKNNSLEILYKTTLKNDLAIACEKIKCETMIVDSTQDFEIPTESGKALYTALAQNEKIILKTVSPGSHWLHKTNPYLFNSYVHEFIS